MTTPNPPILDAASILLIDAAPAEPRLLMGLRQPDNAFLPSKWVFPGGRLEAADADVRAADELGAGDGHALMKDLRAPASKGLARALALAAVRELFEETGHALAQQASQAGDVNGSNGIWHEFSRLGLVPRLAPLRFIARAITPPGRSRRYDTRFFIAARTDAIENAATADGEFADLNWFTIAQARDLDLPTITRRILADLETILAEPQTDAVPFYYEDMGVHRRDLIARTPQIA